MFIDELQKYEPYDLSQQRNKEILMNYYDLYKDTMFLRKEELFHVTSSSVILNKKMDKMLMTYHNIYKSFGWQGGHNDGDENCLNVAIKEAKEETSLTDFLVLPKIYSIDFLPVCSHMKNMKYVPAHLHLNVCYVFIADENSHIQIKEDENSAIEWVNINDIPTKCSEPELTEIYLRIIKKVRGDIL